MSEAEPPEQKPLTHTSATTHHRRRADRNRFVDVIRAWPRLFICFAIAIVAGLAMPQDWRLATRVLLAWNLLAIIYFGLQAELMSTATHESMRRRAKLQDENRFAILIVSVLAAVASLVAIVAQLGAVKDMSGAPKALYVGLSGLTIVTAWTFIHLMFTLHYAHEFFHEWHGDSQEPAEVRGGLHFPGTALPTYSDFLYFAFIIGVASQTADVEITSKPMRRMSLAHSILSFFFNTTLLALTINIAAGLI